MKLRNLLESKFKWNLDAIAALFILVGFDAIHVKVFLTDGRTVEGLLDPPGKNQFVVFTGIQPDLGEAIPLEKISKVEIAPRDKKTAALQIARRLLQKLTSPLSSVSKKTENMLEPVADHIGVLTPDIKKIIEYIKQQKKK